MSQSVQQNQSQTEKGVSTSAVDWQKRCQELIAERDKLQMELAEVKKDRDDYLRAVKALLPEKEYSFTKEELLSQVCKHPSFEEFIAELEKEPGN
ncbi:MAG TPA: hypothetical protein VNX28_17180 [Gemmataceae bacterium]|jgi:hypothetical protein|nr:hypothetical protein [Gemmataceae bacterium]